MNKREKFLNQLPLGSFGVIKGLFSQGDTRRRMLDLGLIYGTKIRVLQQNFAGNLTAYQVRGAVIAFRIEDAATILVESTV